MAAKKKVIQTFNAIDLDVDADNFDPQNKKLETIKLSLPPERKKGIILEGLDEEIAKQLVKIIREEKKII